MDWSTARWDEVVAKPGVSLRGLCVVDAKTVWATGSAGTVLRSVDGGTTWQDVPPPDTKACDFRDVHAFDADTAIVMVAGQPARLYRTTDAGATWTIVHEDLRPEAFFDAIAFASGHGFLFGDAVGGAFTVLYSDDFGASWKAVDGAALPVPVGAEAGFAASGTCACMAMSLPLMTLGYTPRPKFAVWIATGGAASRCLRSLDFATSWRSTDLPLVQGTASQGAFGVAFDETYFGFEHARGVAIGGDYQQPLRGEGTAAWTADGGETWHACVGGAGGYRSCVVWLDLEHVLAVGERGASLSSDSGHTWQPFGELGFHAAATGPVGSVFACGSGGRIARLVVEPRRE